MNNYSTFASEGANELTFGTDDYGLITDLYDAKSSIYPVNMVEFATWDKDYLPDYDRPYWPAEWRKIFTANLILANLSKVEGSQELK
ncbi:hypothetical protein MQE36_15975 [Zhouia spongiae]|uniref:Uncharacterized protein n=1 Tax=Zhouia spongiae TaxID=2202721 RepID=A0ABY3YL49_9FLAO|nr:hypothetical protein [Zhouia spongiae]UNY98565.1 hypothetical protein MQE36_15975 [Zhouia spongiae]